MSATGRWLSWAALAAATVASIVLAVVPSYGPSGESLVSREGPWIVGLLAVPVLLVVVGQMARRRGSEPAAVAAAVVLGLMVVLGSASIGLFYLPALVLIVLSYTK